jgi:hypothetical protein
MSNPLTGNPRAQRWVTAVGTAGTATASIDDGGAPATLVVIDHIRASLDRAAGGLTTLTIFGQTHGRQRTAAAGTTEFDIDFGAGLPCWTSANSDTAVNTSNSVVIGGGGGADACSILVTYHYEIPGERRN